MKKEDLNKELRAILEQQIDTITISRKEYDLMVKSISSKENDIKEIYSDKVKVVNEIKRKRDLAIKEANERADRLEKKYANVDLSLKDENIELREEVLILKELVLKLKENKKKRPFEWLRVN